MSAGIVAIAAIGGRDQTSASVASSGGQDINGRVAGAVAGVVVGTVASAIAVVASEAGIVATSVAAFEVFNLCVIKRIIRMIRIKLV